MIQSFGKNKTPHNAPEWNATVQAVIADLLSTGFATREVLDREWISFISLAKIPKKGLRWQANKKTLALFREWIAQRKRFNLLGE